MNANRFFESHMIMVYFKFVIVLLFFYPPAVYYAYLSCIKHDYILPHVLFSIKYITKLDKYKIIKFFLFLISYYNFMGIVWHSAVNSIQALVTPKFLYTLLLLKLALFSSEIITFMSFT